MKFKKVILSLALALCLALPMFLVGCGDNTPQNQPAWGKTFSYSGAYYDNLEGYMIKNDENGKPIQNGTSIRTLIRQQYLAGNLDLSAVEVEETSSTIDLSSVISGDQLIFQLHNTAKVYFTRFANTTVRLSEKEDAKVTVNNTTYDLREVGNYSIQSEIIENDIIVGFVGTTIHNGATYKNGLTFSINSLKDTFNTVNIKIYTNSPITDPSAHTDLETGRTYLEITFTPVLTWLGE